MFSSRFFRGKYLPSIAKKVFPMRHRSLIASSSTTHLTIDAMGQLNTIEMWSSVLIICFNVFLWSLPSKNNAVFRAKKKSLPMVSKFVFGGSMA